MEFKPTSDFLNVLISRGFVQDCTDLEGLDRVFAKTPQSAYIGFDATADSLHVGSLIQIMLLRWLQKTGHRPIVLMGGGTTKIGDPSGKDESRKLLSSNIIEQNIKGIRNIFEAYIQFGDAGNGAIMSNNAAWLDQLNYVEFLRNYGRHFTVNRMLSFESVKRRLDRQQPLTFLEFNYMLLQAYDFMELNARFDCRLQMGGSDQWGNIVNGVDLTRRINGSEVYGLTSPLLQQADGSKMGKTASGAVWLNPERISAFDFWQFWRNTADADTGRFLLLFTEIDLDECHRMATLEGSELNVAKAMLATEVTTLAFGRTAAENVEKAARALFGSERSNGGGKQRDRSQMDDRLPVCYVEITDAEDRDVSVVRLFVQSGLVKSGKEAKRLIQDGGARVDHVAISEPALRISHERLSEGVVLSAGKKRHVRVLAG
ncbi:MAG: tyrosine--tRNA ligase [Rhodobacteraceae bacterium]|nr:tyrosine--tRNA ligase [Paracoccaceae bacterium]